MTSALIPAVTFSATLTCLEPLLSSARHTVCQLPTVSLELQRKGGKSAGGMETINSPVLQFAQNIPSCVKKP